MFAQWFQKRTLLKIEFDPQGRCLSRARSIYGKIQAYDQETCLVARYDQAGQFQGYALFDRWDVCKFSEDTDETRMVNARIERKGERMPLSIRTGMSNSNLKWDFLREMQREKNLLFLDIGTESGYFPLYGIIHELDCWNLMQIERVDSCGKKDGFVISRPDVHYVEMNSEECRRRSVLYGGQSGSPSLKAGDGTVEDVLRYLYEKQCAAEFEINFQDMPDHLHIGTVEAWDDHDVLLRLYDEKGNFDGFYLTWYDGDARFAQLAYQTQRTDSWKPVVSCPEDWNGYRLPKGEQSCLREELAARIADNHRKIRLESGDGWFLMGMLPGTDGAIGRWERYDRDGEPDGCFYAARFSDVIYFNTEYEGDHKPDNEMTSDALDLPDLLEKLYASRNCIEVMNARTGASFYGYLLAWEITDDDCRLIMEEYDECGNQKANRFYDFGDDIRIITGSRVLEQIDRRVKNRLGEKTESQWLICGKTDQLLDRSLHYAMERGMSMQFHEYGNEQTAISGVVRGISDKLLILGSADSSEPGSGMILVFQDAVESVIFQKGTANAAETLRRLPTEDADWMMDVSGEDDVIKFLWENQRAVRLYQRQIGKELCGVIVAWSTGIWTEILLKAYDHNGNEQGLFFFSLHEFRVQINSAWLRQIEEKVHALGEKRNDHALFGKQKDLEQSFYAKLNREKGIVTLWNDNPQTESGIWEKEHDGMLIIRQKNEGGTYGTIYWNSYVQMIRQEE